MTDQEYRQLQENAHLLEELTKQPGWAVLRGYLLDRSGTRQAHLVNGSAKTYDAYREEVGWLKGAHFVERIPEEVGSLLAAETTRRAAGQAHEG